MKKIYLSLFFLLIGKITVAQTTETFETENNGSTSFTDNSQVFNITSQAGGTFNINSVAGAGWNGTTTDNKFIDNSATADIGIPAQFTIKSSGNQVFKLKSMYLFLSQSNLNPGVGTCTITGKIGNITAFIATASTGFNSNMAVNNGYSLINLVNYGGTDNSNTNIDSFIVSTTGSYEYVALDAMKWDIGTTLSVADFKNNSFRAYPNPVTNTLNIENSEELLTVKISTITGQIVIQKSILAKNATIDLSSLNAGVYLAEIKSLNGNRLIKLIKN